MTKQPRRVDVGGYAFSKREPSRLPELQKAYFNSYPEITDRTLIQASRLMNETIEAVNFVSPTPPDNNFWRPGLFFYLGETPADVEFAAIWFPEPLASHPVGLVEVHTTSNVTDAQLDRLIERYEHRLGWVLRDQRGENRAEDDHYARRERISQIRFWLIVAGVIGIFALAIYAASQIPVPHS